MMKTTAVMAAFLGLAMTQEADGEAWADGGEAEAWADQSSQDEWTNIFDDVRYNSYRYYGETSAFTDFGSFSIYLRRFYPEVDIHCQREYWDFCILCVPEQEAGYCYEISEDRTLEILQWYYTFTSSEQDQDMFAYFGASAFGSADAEGEYDYSNNTSDDSWDSYDDDFYYDDYSNDTTDELDESDERPAEKSVSEQELMLKAQFSTVYYPEMEEWLWITYLSGMASWFGWIVMIPLGSVIYGWMFIDALFI